MAAFPPLDPYAETVFSVLADVNAGRLVSGQAKMADLLTRAGQGTDTKAQAWACYLMARLAQIGLTARPGRALPLALESAHLFSQTDDRASESMALSLASLESSLRGVNDEAIEHALLAVQLLDALPEGLHAALAYNYLGVATTWTDGAYARQALRRSVAIARTHGGPTATAQPLINLVLAELYRIETCLQSGQPVHVDPGARAALDDLSLLQRGDTEPCPLMPGLPGALLGRILPWLRLGVDSFLGGDRSGVDTATLPDPDALPLPWMSVLIYWIRARYLLSRGELSLAESAIEVAYEKARCYRQSRVMLVVQYLRVELFQQRARPDLALAAFREFRHLQLTQASTGLPVRERVARLHMAWRQQRTVLQSLKHHSRYLEKLSLEDSLTGLANRRCLEQTVAALLSGQADRGGGAPWCLVMMDVDRFKQINDRHSHVVGDEVLCRIAEVMSGVLRADDLAVRMAGDEFVLIVFDVTDDASGQFVERLRTAIEQQDWASLAPGLSVTVSLGVSQARAHDTPSELLRRSDLKMYADKIRRRTGL